MTDLDLDRFVDACQRWTHHEQTWRRPEDGGFDKTAYEVKLIDYQTARAFVMTHHYSRSFGAVKRCGRFGLIEKATDGKPEQLVGVAAYGVPVHKNVILNAFPTLWYNTAAELLRFVLLHDVPSNAETWFNAQCLHALAKAGLRGVIAHSDPVERIADGKVIMPGHIGGIYRDGGWSYVGQASAGTMRLFDDGTCLNDRSAEKLPAGHRGGGGVHDLLVARGAAPMTERDDPRGWLKYWTEMLTTAVEQPGVHKYVKKLGPPTHQRATPMVLEVKKPPTLADVVRGAVLRSPAKVLMAA